MFAPEITRIIRNVRSNRDAVLVDKKTQKYVKQFFDNMLKIEPYDKDGEIREIWVTAQRGSIQEFGDFESFKEDELVETYEEFEEWWKDEFPDETVWFRLVAVKRDDYQALFVNDVFLYQSRSFKNEYEYDLSDFFKWANGALNEAIKKLESDTYHSNVSKNLSPDLRTGTINRKDYWDIFNENRESYFSNITKEEVYKFVNYINEQKDEPVGNFISDMNAHDFYSYCKIGYEANNYDKAFELSAKELYYKYADGRDEGLSKIDEYSNEEFKEWFFDRDRFGGHPWEVCAGGNSTHIDLFVCHCDRGYYLILGGKAWSRSIETVKFYNALRDNGVAVYLRDANGIKNRLLETDLIGIVPKTVIPVYCESYFPEAEVLDFIHLPYEFRDIVLKKVTWHEERKIKLKK